VRSVRHQLVTGSGVTVDIVDRLPSMIWLLVGQLDRVASRAVAAIRSPPQLSVNADAHELYERQHQDHQSLEPNLPEIERGLTLGDPTDTSPMHRSITSPLPHVTSCAGRQICPMWRQPAYCRPV
jgi:hypothetical protein